MTPMDKIKTINEDIQYVNKNKNTIVDKYKDRLPEKLSGGQQ